jgi:hypothetical protein
MERSFGEGADDLRVVSSLAAESQQKSGNNTRTTLLDYNYTLSMERTRLDKEAHGRGKLLLSDI